jgi:sec-independent protein translocase protein TatC
MLYRLLNGLFKAREKSRGPAASPGGEPPEDNSVKPFLDHLEDLRWTAIKMASTLFVAMILAFIFAHEIFHFMQHPLREAGLDPIKVLRFETLGGPIMTSISVSFYAGLVVSMPLHIYFLGQFILPALTMKEKRYIVPGIAVGFFLFLGGAAFCFYEILPRMIAWLSDYATKSGIQTLYDAKEYLSTISHMCIAFGLLCELPIVMITLNGIGLVSYKWLAGTRAYAIAGVLVLSAVISPTSDLVTLFLLAGPIILLYEACIWIVWYLDKRRAKLEAIEETRLNRPYDDRPPDEPID